MSPRPSFGWETFWVALYRLLADRPAIAAAQSQKAMSRVAELAVEPFSASVSRIRAGGFLLFMFCKNVLRLVCRRCIRNWLLAMGPEYYAQTFKDMLAYPTPTSTVPLLLFVCGRSSM